MSERQAAIPGGVLLYDEQLVEDPDNGLFEPLRAQDAPAGEAPGRGTVLFLPRDPVDWVLRHYCRGGWIGRWIDDSFLFAGTQRTRSFREWRLLYRMRALDLPVPRPVAARFRRHGLVYTADLITERIAATPLSRHLVLGGVPVPAWQAIGAMLARFHAAGVFHADLTAHNILLDDVGRPWLLDFDRGAFRHPGGWRRRNLQRLQRSLRKIAPQVAERDFPRSQWQVLQDAYARSS